MKLKLKGDSIFLLVMLAIAAVFVILALPMRHTSSKLLPLMIGGSMLVLSAAGFVMSLKTTDKKAHPAAEAEPEAKKEANEDDSSVRAYIPIALWIGGYSLGVWLLGFLIATPVFTLAYTKTHEMKWPPAIITAAGTTVGVWLGFEVLLKAELFRGILF